MFRRILLACIIVHSLAPEGDASADGLFYEAGPGFYDSGGSRADFLRYRHEGGTFFGLDVFYEASYAFWNGPDHDEAVALAPGIRWWKNDSGYASFTLGPSRIIRTTSNLGQPFQFYIRLAYERNVGRALVALGWVHYSDGKLLFGWSGSNNSENFATLSVGMMF